ncbi:type 1 fimbrial protein [Enterobacteriaceae bacterium]
MLYKKTNAPVFILCLTFNAIALPLPAMAESTAINIAGNIIASPCEVSSDSVTKAIALDGGKGIQATGLAAAGSTTEWVKFDINLKNCPAGTTAATITFTGTPDENNPEDMYANAGTAKNAAVELQGTGGHKFGNGKSFTYSPIDNNAVSFHLQSRVYTQNGGVTPGTISAVVTANMTYQ